MLIFYIGTRAQIIKMAPVILEVEKMNLPITIVFTGQHKETMEELVDDFGIKTTAVYLYEGPEVTGILQMAKWFFYCLRKAQKNRSTFVPTQSGQKNVMIIHGDTFSTLLGAIVGKLNKIDVAHVESGLRSFNVFHPFPEELTRLITFRLSNTAFCPGEWAFENVKKYKLVRVNTIQNTLIDSLRCALSSEIASPIKPRNELYGVCSIHRFENIFNRKQLEKIVSLIEQVTKSYLLVFVLHPATHKKLADFGLLERLENNSNIELHPRMSYVKFIKLIKDSVFVITDGGSNQEELSYLGIPTCLMRKKTERQEGLDTTVTICNYDHRVMQKFVADLPKNKVNTLVDQEEFPSNQIANYLEKTTTSVSSN